MRLHWLLWLPSALAALLAGAAAGGLLEPWRPSVSYWLKHTPLCMAENVGLVAPRRAHYVPAFGRTADVLYCTPAKPPQLAGGLLGHDVIIVSDMGGVVQRIDSSGRLVWQRRLSMPRGLDLHGNRLLVGEGSSVRVLSVTSGAELQRYEFDQPILMVRHLGNSLYTLMNIEGQGAVRRYELSENGPRLVRSTPVVTRYPRGIDVGSAGVYVADTFGNRVIRLDSDSLELRAQAAAYFPNSVQLMGDHLLVSEEHLNVVSEFRAAPLERMGLLLGCRAHPVGANLPAAAPVRICRGSSAAAELYSPNDVFAVDKLVYVADTDNHRVIVFLKGHLVAQLTGFNNPVNVRVVRP
jgi:hypothetical protein